MLLITGSNWYSAHVLLHINFIILTPLQSAEELSISCPVCGKVYRTKPGLQYHLKSQHGPEQKEVCVSCIQPLTLSRTLTQPSGGFRNLERGVQPPAHEAQAKFLGCHGNFRSHKCTHDTRINSRKDTVGLDKRLEINM